MPKLNIQAKTREQELVKAYLEENASDVLAKKINEGELVKVTVAVKCRKKHWYCKQVAVHGLHSEICFVKDISYNYLGGYSVGWYKEGLQKYSKWYESADWGCHYDKYFDPYAPVVNIEYAVSFCGALYKYSACTLYPYTDILQYLRIYEKYPQVEYMVKAGLFRYVKSKQILEKARKDKRFCKWLYVNRETLNSRPYYINTVCGSYKTGKPLDTLQAYCETKKKLCCDDSLAPVLELFQGKEQERLIEYIEKQKTNLNTYRDYVKACNYLGVDLSLPKNRFPHDFKQWHDIRIDQYVTARAEKDREKREKFYKQFALVAEKYLPLQHLKGKNYICLIAKSPAELIYEGEQLDHCVGRMNYDRRFVREESLIFFIRNCERPDVPFVTVEYSLSLHKVLQCYGEHDHKPDENVLHYVNKIWLPYANRHLKQIAA